MVVHNVNWGIGLPVNMFAKYQLVLMVDVAGYMKTPVAQLIIWLSVLLILSVIGLYIVRRYRGGKEDNETTSTLLTKFKDSRYRGELNESEFRTIKTILAERMQAEIKRKDGST